MTTMPRDVAWDLAEHVAGFDAARMAPGDLDAVRLLVLDTLACLLAGSGEAPFERLRALHPRVESGRAATVMVHGDRLMMRDAVAINSGMARALDLDDVHEGAIVHTGVHVVPTALAVAESLGGVPGPEVAAAIALGQDLMIRLSLACETPPVLRGRPGTYVFGTFATAAVTARLLGLDVRATADALGNAYARAAGTTLGYQEGALAQRAMQGLSASAGVFAAELAAEGIGGMADCLEGTSGYYAVHEAGRYDRALITADLGTRLHGTDTALKPYPVHRGAVIDLEAALTVARRHRFDPTEITAVRVRYPTRFTEGLERIRAFDPERADPVGPVAPHFSSSWAVAVALVRGQASIDDFTEAGVRRLRASVVPVARRVTGVPDPSLDSSVPGLGARIVEVELADGTVLAERVDHAPGSPEQPWGWDDVLAKLDDCAGRAARPIPPAALSDVVSVVAELGDLGGIPARLVGEPVGPPGA